MMSIKRLGFGEELVRVGWLLRDMKYVGDSGIR